MKKLFYLVGLLMIASTIFIGCRSEDPYEPTPPPEPPVLPTVIAVSTINQVIDAERTTRDLTREFIIDVTGNIYVNRSNVGRLSAFGNFENRENVIEVNWGRTRSSDTYLVIPTETIVLAYHTHQQQFGAVPLGSGADDAGWIATPTDAPKFAAAGVTATQVYAGENIYIANADELAIWIPVFQDFVSSMRGAGNGELAKVTFNEEIANGERGLRVGNSNMDDLETLVQYATITNNNLMPNERDVLTTTEVLRLFNPQGNGRFNGGHLFKILGVANDADLAKMEPIMNGMALRTDTADLRRTDLVVPDIAFLRQQERFNNAQSRLQGLPNNLRPIRLEADGSPLQNRLTHFTQPDLTRISTPRFPSGSAMFHLEAPVLTSYIEEGRGPTAQDFYGAIDIQFLNDHVHDLSMERLMESHDVANNYAAMRGRRRQLALLDVPDSRICPNFNPDNFDNEEHADWMRTINVYYQFPNRFMSLARFNERMPLIATPFHPRNASGTRIRFTPDHHISHLNNYRRYAFTVVMPDGVSVPTFELPDRATRDYGMSFSRFAVISESTVNHVYGNTGFWR